MPRIRSIHPDACDSEKLAQLSDSAERTLWRLITHLDDEGRAEDRPKLLAAKLYPLVDDKAAEDVDCDIEELQRVGMLIRYQVDSKRYLQAPTFGDWQKPRHPTASKLPPPPEPDDTDPEPDDSPADDDGPPTAERGNAPEDVDKPPAGEGVGGGVGVGGGEVLAPTASPPKRPPDPIWDAVMAACGLEQAELTDSARGAANKAVQQLRKIGAEPAQIADRARRYVQTWPGVSLTPSALAKNYAQLGAHASNGVRAGPRTVDRHDTTGEF